MPPLTTEDQSLFNLHVYELEALVLLHKHEWKDRPHMPITLRKLGGNTLVKIGAVIYAYDGKKWVRV